MRLAHLRSASPLRIGLLGGSFNPAHAGHVHISLEAIRRLELDIIIWLVSPANPLKDPETLAAFDKRFAYATQLITHPRIMVSDYEQRHGLYYTHATLTHLLARYPQHHFVWLMGGDNLAGFHHWQGWKEIANTLPIAVLDRAPFAKAALHSPAAQWLASNRCYYRELATAPTPAWDYVPIRRHALSATSIRHQYGEKTWQSHVFKA